MAAPAGQPVQVQGVVLPDVRDLRCQADVARVRARKALLVAVALHALAFLVINIAVWVIYGISGSHGDWAKWATLGTAMFLGFHAASTLPIAASSFGWTTTWAIIVVGCLLVVNVGAWVVWSFTKCRGEAGAYDHCGDVWPVWVLMGTIFCGSFVAFTPMCLKHFAISSGIMGKDVDAGPGPAVANQGGAAAAAHHV